MQFLPGKSHGQTSLEGYSLWGHKRVWHSLATKTTQQTNSVALSPYHCAASPLSIFRTLFYLAKWKLYNHQIVTSRSLFLLTPGNHHSTFCLYEFDYSRYHMEEESYSISLFVPDISLSLISLMFIHVVEYVRISFLLWMNNIPL